MWFFVLYFIYMYINAYYGPLAEENRRLHEMSQGRPA